MTIPPLGKKIEIANSITAERKQIYQKAKTLQLKDLRFIHEAPQKKRDLNNRVREVALRFSSHDAVKYSNHSFFSTKQEIGTLSSDQGSLALLVKGKPAHIFSEKSFAKAFQNFFGPTTTIGLYKGKIEAKAGERKKNSYEYLGIASKSDLNKEVRPKALIVKDGLGDHYLLRFQDSQFGLTLADYSLIKKDSQEKDIKVTAVENKKAQVSAFAALFRALKSAEKEAESTKAKEEKIADLLNCSIRNLKYMFRLDRKKSRGGANNVEEVLHGIVKYDLFAGQEKEEVVKRAHMLSLFNEHCKRNQINLFAGQVELNGEKINAFGFMKKRVDNLGLYYFIANKIILSRTNGQKLYVAYAPPELIDRTNPSFIADITDPENIKVIKSQSKQQASALKKLIPIINSYENTFKIYGKSAARDQDPYIETNYTR